MEKRGVIDERVTPDTEGKVESAKSASADEPQDAVVEALDDDLTKQAAEKAQQRLA